MLAAATATRNGGGGEPAATPTRWTLLVWGSGNRYYITISDKIIISRVYRE